MKGQLEGLMQKRVMESKPCFFVFFDTASISTALRKTKMSALFPGTVCLKMNLFLKKSECGR